MLLDSLRNTKSHQEHQRSSTTNIGWIRPEAERYPWKATSTQLANFKTSDEEFSTKLDQAAHRSGTKTGLALSSYNRGCSSCFAGLGPCLSTSCILGSHLIARQENAFRQTLVSSHGSRSSTRMINKRFVKSCAK